MPIVFAGLFDPVDAGLLDASWQVPALAAKERYCLAYIQVFQDGVAEFAVVPRNKRPGQVQGQILNQLVPLRSAISHVEASSTMPDEATPDGDNSLFFLLLQFFGHGSANASLP